MPGIRPRVHVALAGVAAAALAAGLHTTTLVSATAPEIEPPRATSTNEPIGAGERSGSARGRYIVEVAGDVDAVVAREEQRGVDVTRQWNQVGEGFAAELTDAEVARLERDPAVADVHPDAVVTIDDVQDNPPWGLDRIDQRDRPLSGSYGYSSSGVGVTAYVVDTGIRTTHAEFTGRIGPGAFIDFGDGRSVEDCNGHGTHVAGTLGGTVSGVAKAVRLVPVKVFDCGGTALVSDVIAGLNWIVGDHQPGERAVVNMSLGTDIASPPLDAAVNGVIADGITVVAAAGNSSVPSCNGSPARVADAITVAATNSNDTRATYSNTGSCNDLFAPGTGIVSAGIASDTAAATKSGTSMAAPHVAGAVARLLELDPAATPADLRTAIDQATNPGVLNRSFGDPDKLLYVVAVPPVCVAPPGGIIGWWTGDDNPSAVVGPTLVGSAAYGSGHVGSAFAFDGTSWLTAPGVATVSTGVTVEAWVRPGADTRVQTVAARWDFPSTDDSARTFALTLQPGGRLVFETDETSTRRPEVLSVSVPQLLDGRFHHVAATWDRVRAVLFVDGVEVATRVSQGGSLNPALTTAVTIGGQTRGLSTTGIVDEATIYSRALGAAEVEAIHLADRAGKCR